MKKSVSILTIGDPHFKINNVQQTSEMVTRIINLARERKPDLIVCLGDVLDKHAHIHVDPLCDAINLFNPLSDIAPLVIIIGNHDRRNNEDFLTDRHPFTALKRVPNVQIVDNIQVRWLKGHLLVFVPYVPPGRFIEALDTYPNFEKEVINDCDKSQSWLNKWDLTIDDLSYSEENSTKVLRSMVGPEVQDKLNNIFGNEFLSEMDIYFKHRLQFKLQKEIREKNTTDLTPKSRCSFRKPFSKEKEPLQHGLSERVPCLSPGLAQQDSLSPGLAQQDSLSQGFVQQDSLSQRWWWKASLIAGHQEFYEGRMGAIISTKGDKWPKDGPLVVTGHFHDNHRPQENIWYTGTPIQHSNGDNPDKKISILHWTEESGWLEERVDLGVIKRKTIRLTVQKFMKWTPPSGYLLKVVLECTPGELKALKLLPKIDQLKQEGIKISIKTISNKSSPIPSSHNVNQDYLTALHQELKDQNSLYWFNKIFGTLNNKPKLQLKINTPKRLVLKIK